MTENITEKTDEIRVTHKLKPMQIDENYGNLFMQLCENILQEEIEKATEAKDAIQEAYLIGCYMAIHFVLKTETQNETFLIIQAEEAKRIFDKFAKTSQVENKPELTKEINNLKKLEKLLEELKQKLTQDIKKVKESNKSDTPKKPHKN